MNIEVYSFEGADGTPDGYMTQDIEKARAHAREHNLKLIANTFEFVDSELVEDHTRCFNCSGGGYHQFTGEPPVRCNECKGTGEA